MGPHRTPTRRHHPRRTNRRIIGPRHTRQSRPTSRSQCPTAPTISPTNRRQNPKNPHPLPILTPRLTHQSKRFFLGLRLLAAYCPPYGSAAVLLPLRNTHVLACYVLGSRLAPTTCEHTHAFFGATPQCALPILVMAHKAPPKPKNAAFRDAARRWRTKLSQKQKMRHLTGGSEMPLGLR